MAIPIYIVDAFASKPFTGNPAAICFPDKKYDDSWRQALAGEINLSETAFLVRNENGWGLRWFTPRTEVDLCGHATLAASHILWETGRLNSSEPAVFWTRSGKLTCLRKDSRIEMDFPAEPAVETTAPPELLAGLGAKPLWVGRNRMDWVAVIDSEETVRNLVPNLNLLEKVQTRGIIVTARSSGEFDFVSRSFFPRCGVPEDPVCGSAHCCLGPLWRKQLNKDCMTAFQASQRSGIVYVSCAGERVELGGQAVTVMSGELRV